MRLSRCDTSRMCSTRGTVHPHRLPREGPLAPRKPRRLGEAGRGSGGLQGAPGASTACRAPR